VAVTVRPLESLLRKSEVIRDTRRSPQSGGGVRSLSENVSSGLDIRSLFPWLLMWKLSLRKPLEKMTVPVFPGCALAVAPRPDGTARERGATHAPDVRSRFCLWALPSLEMIFALTVP